MNLPSSWFSMSPYARGWYLVNTHQAANIQEAMKKVKPSRPKPKPKKEILYWWHD